MTLSFFRSDKPVYTTLIRPIGPCQPTPALEGPIFSHLWNPYPTFPGGVHDLYRRLYIELGRPYGGFPDFVYLDPFGPQAPYQLLGTQSGNFGPPSRVTVLLSHHVMINTDNTTVVSCINKQVGTHSHTLLRLVVDLFLWLQTQDIVIRARQIPGCLNVIADRLSQLNQPITTEWGLHPEIVTRIFGTWGTLTLTCLPQSTTPIFPSLCLRSRASRTGDRCSDTGLAGEVNVCVSTFSPAQQNHSETKYHPGGRGYMYSNSPMVAITTVVSTSTLSVCGPPCVWTILASFRTAETYCHNRPGYVSDGKSYHLHTWRLSCSTTKQQDFQKRSPDSRQLLEDPQQTECMTTGSFALLTGPQDKELISLVPQLLK